MESWQILPAASLRARGPDSEALLRAGCTTFRQAARTLQQLPYGRNSDRGDFRLVLSERRGTCSTKHALLASAARELELPVALAIGIYDLTEANTPGVGAVLAAHGLTSLPEAHCHLRYAGRRVDITRAGASPREPAPDFRAEWRIEPFQIGDYKVALHRRYLGRWLAERPDLRLSLDELWTIREACIRALSGA